MFISKGAFIDSKNTSLLLNPILHVKLNMLFYTSKSYFMCTDKLNALNRDSSYKTWISSNNSFTSNNILYYNIQYLFISQSAAMTFRPSTLLCNNCIQDLDATNQFIPFTYSTILVSFLVNCNDILDACFHRLCSSLS